MCDTMVAVPPATQGGAVWFGKNSDREPGEAQAVVHLPAQRLANPARVQCTYVELEQASQTYEVVLSQPFWMWGAEMGANEHGLAIGNEAVFTKLPVELRGLTGMDLVRLALERTTCAREALELITDLLQSVGQGGLCGYRKKKFRYHNSFLLADPQEAWVLETAGPYWAAARVKGVRAISNALSLEREFDLLGPGTFEFARQRGWCKNATDFNFAESFGDRLYRTASGGRQRRACLEALLNRRPGEIGFATMAAALRDHAGQQPEDGWRMEMPCAHASWQPTRQAGQTTGSMVSRLLPQGNSLHWFTGTAAPCLSVFKPFVLGQGELDSGPRPAAGYDAESLFWQHERLHRLTLADFGRRAAVFQTERQQLEQICSVGLQTGRLTDNYLQRHCQAAWDGHRARLAAWLAAVQAQPAADHRSSLLKRYWEQQNKLDQVGT